MREFVLVIDIVYVGVDGYINGLVVGEIFVFFEDGDVEIILV